MNVATMTIARHLATKAIKSEWRRQKMNWVWVEHSELVQASMAYLAEHPELIEEAAEIVRNDPKLRTLANRHERKRKEFDDERGHANDDKPNTPPIAQHGLQAKGVSDRGGG